MNKPATVLTPPTLNYDEVISFGTNGVATRLETRGFDMADGEHHSWTQRPTAEIEFGLRLPNDRVELKVEALPFLPPTVLAQQVFIFMNGLMVGFMTLSDRQRMRFPIERSTISSRQNRLSFIIPTAVSPHALGLGDDQRQLGIALISMTFAAGSA